MSYRREAKVNASMWILVADGARATVYRTTWPEAKQFETVESLVHAEGAAQPHEVLTDRPGRFAGPGHMHQSGDPDVNFRRQTAIDFAIQIVETLERGRNQNEFGRVMLVAPPLLLGILREKISAPLAKQIVGEIGKDYVHLPPHELKSTLQELIAEQSAAVL
ncbi:host attachment protein [Planctomicrobium sp. SH664]|uniref:host attachment protein n=1 Tax=Planctomicrobium sp. SH664 TaxID=3448125 RepID=UPI003F5C8C17